MYRTLYCLFLLGGNLAFADAKIIRHDTHVKSTGEVGFIELKREHPGKSNERIEIRLKGNT